MGNSNSRPVRTGRSWTFSGAPRKRSDSLPLDYSQRSIESGQNSFYTAETSLAMHSRGGSVATTRTAATVPSSPNPSLRGSARTSSSTEDSGSPPCSPRLRTRPRADTAGARLRRILTLSSRRYVEGTDGECIDLDQVPYKINDYDREIDRQHLDHYLLRLGLSGNRFAPVPQPKRVLDIGTGSGIWMLEMAAEYPECNFVGVDVALLQRYVTAVNCDFRLMNVLDGLRFADNQFDLVFQRLLISSIPTSQWPTHLSECARICQPGGWVEMIESDGLIHQRDGSEATSPSAALYNQCVRSLLHRVDIDPGLVRRLGDMFRVAAGLSDVHQRVYRIPIGYGALGSSSGRGHRSRAPSLASRSSVSVAGSSTSGGASMSGTSPQLALTARMAKEVLSTKAALFGGNAVKAGLIGDKDVATHFGDRLRDEVDGQELYFEVVVCYGRKPSA
ncbi:S-adenosyl-L-methionine-dependent methyltransferase [Thamnocephalis sphaerospora]|uniref:S-adenosyl-L-methionine-dependent methyltransferase n=1 Tax=Thamnocephalis sphaerospora TaxID=78915 RepID=A0A4P9XU82_9FUNG|nr:S-adenosyl-L-methionine-dependent methyltransferase [Thamnocephalis sphaerospora]|eukprot:RKP09141.1 S-adenosyl-L-methionine-dependent methyltransferase [Thamnocephalis sphaerospora]